MRGMNGSHKFVILLLHPPAGGPQLDFTNAFAILNSMDDYIKKTLRAYDDVEKYESGTSKLIPKIELDKFLDLLKNGSSILDAGCAFGRDTGYMQNLGYAAEGSDLSVVLVNRAKELYPSISFTVADIRKLPYNDRRFDGIWCNATLLHLNDDDMKIALVELRRILKTNGALCCSLKKGEGEDTFVENFSSNSERYFNYKTIESFESLIKEAGFEIISSHYLNERERYGKDKRDLDWLYTYARKV